MAVRMTPVERAEYEALPRTEKIKMTMRLKRDRAAEKEKLREAKELVAHSLVGSLKTGDARKPKATNLTPRDLRGRLDGILEQYQYNPLEELIKRRMKKGKNKMDDKEALALDKFMVPYVTPTLKSVDLQQDMKMSVSVGIVSFAATRASDLVRPEEQARKVDPAEYQEFLDNVEDDAALFEEIIGEAHGV